jgi:acetyl esterase/lipase
MGRSAGGTLAVLLAVTGGEEELEGAGGHASFSSRVQASVGIAGVYDFVARFTDEEQIALQPNVKTKINSNGEWIGAPFAAHSEPWRSASATNHVDGDDPPVLLIHSKDDSTVPWAQSRDMHAALRKAGVAADLQLYDEGGHGVNTKGPPDPNERMMEFFRKTLVTRRRPEAGPAGA